MKKQWEKNKEMLAATKVKMSGREKKEQEHVRYFLHKTSNQEVSRFNKGKECTKKCAARAKLLFAN